MCCIFTCCGWMVDLIQRLWTFTMSCCISSAVCCSLVTASMSGVALGYNYSLAEYIELKETNVSVYLKRGVFDDEISDDMDWRRSGHLPVAGHIGESNLMTGASDEATTLRSGRRLDDSIYESNDRSNFEGSLMRLTAKPLETASTFPPSEKSLDDVLRQYTMGSLDQLKAVQGVLNQKKAEAAATRRVSNKKQDDQIIVPEKRPMFPYPESYGRRAMLYTVPTIEPRSTYGSLRSAVPDDQINDLTKWRLPKLPPQSIPFDMQYVDSYMSPTYPSPVTPLPGPAKPTRPIEFARARSRPTRPTPTHTKISAVKHSKGPEIELPKSIDEDMEAFKKKLMEDKFVPPMLTDEDFLKKIDVGKIKANEDYEEDIKGIPLRKKRNIVVTTPKNSFDNKNKATIKDKKQIIGTSTKLGVTVGRVTHGGKTDAGSKDNENLGFAKTAAPTLATSEKSPTNMIIKLLSSTIS